MTEPKVGKHNAPCRVTPPLGARALPALSVWPCGPPWRVGKHKGVQTAIGPSQSPSCSLETARPLGRASRGQEVRFRWGAGPLLVEWRARSVRACILSSWASSHMSRHNWRARSLRACILLTPFALALQAYVSGNTARD